MSIGLGNESSSKDNIINYKCRFRRKKRLNNFFPLSTELFLRWDEVGRIMDIFLSPFHFQRGMGRVFTGEEG
jgi:hypothetical protein